MSHKVLDSIWFGTIGIVAVDSNGFGWKCYIGSATFSTSQDNDAQKIAENGMPTGRAIALATFPNLKATEFKA